MAGRSFQCLTEPVSEQSKGQVIEARRDNDVACAQSRCRTQVQRFVRPFSNSRFTDAFELRLSLIQLRARSHSEEKTDSDLLCVGNFVDDGYMHGTVASTMVCFTHFCLYVYCVLYIRTVN